MGTISASLTKKTYGLLIVQEHDFEGLFLPSALIYFQYLFHFGMTTTRERFELGLNAT